MSAFRCLASLLLLLLVVKAARPRFELVSQAALVAEQESSDQSIFWTDPCAELGAKRKRKLSRIFKKGTLCQCQEGLFTSAHCGKPLVKDFVLPEATSKCRCQDPCKDFDAQLAGAEPAEAQTTGPGTPSAKKNGIRCRCKGRFVTNSHCQKPLAEGFDLTGTHNGLCRCEDPCEQFHAKKEGSWCQCHEGLATNHHCEMPFDKHFSLSDRNPQCCCDQEDPCAKFQGPEFPASAVGTDPQTGEVLCSCGLDDERYVDYAASSECSRPGQDVFSAEGNAAGCRCEHGMDYAQSVKSPVETAALAFCEKASQVNIEFEVPTAETCGGLLSSGAGTHDFGRLDPLLQRVPKTAAWHLERVCRDECVQLVENIRDQLYDMQGDMDSGTPVGETCAARVVKKVEAEILGCCGRSCGWNGRSCISWPFFDEQQKADWQAECCTEYNVLKNSSREIMCNSVLDKRDADLVSKNDLSQEGKDVAAAYLGQDLQLFWTQKGVKSELGKNYTWLKQKPEVGQQVTEQLLQLQPNIRKKALKEGWFEEKKLERASLLQAQEAGASCDPKKMESCTGDMKQWRTSVCAKQEGWLFTPVPSKLKCKDMRKTMKPATSPHKCFEAKYDTVGTNNIKYYAFHYDKEDTENPIKCYAETGETSCMSKTPLAEATEGPVFDRIWFWIDAKSAAESAKSA